MTNNPDNTLALEDVLLLALIAIKMSRRSPSVWKTSSRPSGLTGKVLLNVSCRFADLDDFVKDKQAKYK